MEWLTIFDTEKRKIGKKLRDDVHRDGDWHETFHCWFVEEEKNEVFVYFQLRSPLKKDFPGKWDISAAGHVMDGEDVGEAGVREVEEELGHLLTREDLVYRGIYRGCHEYPGFIDREFCHMYFYVVEQSIAFQPTEEVVDVMKVSTRSLMELVTGVRTEIEVTTIREEPLVVTSDDLYAYETAYYQFVVTEAEKLITQHKTDR